MNNTDVYCTGEVEDGLVGGCSITARLVSRGAGAHGSDAIGGRAERRASGDLKVKGEIAAYSISC